jgi:hypothetical protein
MKSILRNIPTAVLILFLFCSFSHAYKLPDTGQDKCYDSAGNEVTCIPAGTGQDGALPLNLMSFNDNIDTITDNNTGLMWQKNDDNNTHNWYQASGTEHSTYNPAGGTFQDVCGTLNLGTHTDWRLPTRNDLMSIVDYIYQSPGPQIDRIYFPTTKADVYWTTDQNFQNYNDAWYVSFFWGDTRYNSSKSNTFYVRCVRGAEIAPSFTDNGDSTVMDNRTGLMWQQTEPGKKTWDAALDYCNNLVLGSQVDWRLPNIKELESLVYDMWTLPGDYSVYFPNVASNHYWSSTSNVYDVAHRSNAQYVSFSGGDVNYYPKSGDWLNVRCVRAGDSGALSTVKLLHSGGAYAYYSSIQDAYNVAVAGDTIMAQASDFTETLALLTADVTVKLKGGYNSGFTANTLKTTVNGALTIKGGTVTVENLIIRSVE